MGTYLPVHSITFLYLHWLIQLWSKDNGLILVFQWLVLKWNTNLCHCFILVFSHFILSRNEPITVLMYSWWYWGGVEPITFWVAVCSDNHNTTKFKELLFVCCDSPILWMTVTLVTWLVSPVDDIISKGRGSSECQSQEKAMPFFMGDHPVVWVYLTGMWKWTLGLQFLHEFLFI